MYLKSKNQFELNKSQIDRMPFMRNMHARHRLHDSDSQWAHLLAALMPTSCRIEQREDGTEEGESNGDRG